MKKRLLSMALALVLLCSVSAPAAAAQAADDRLTAVTTQVKRTLGLDTEKYTEFYGDLMEDLLAPSWYLEWMGESGNLSVTATETGKVLTYRLYENAETPAGADSFAPSFPAGSQDSAKAAAQSFLKQVLAAGETATIEARAVRLDATAYRFSGEILLNGLPAGLSYSISVRCEDNIITSFSRDDLNGRVMGKIPSARALVSQTRARAALRETLALRLEYVLPAGETQAVLRYLPEYGDEYYVDAATGRLVNLTELAQDIAMGGSGMTTESAKAEAPAAANDALSKAEQEGADRLKNVLGKAALDAKARAVTALGLGAYTLSGADYTVAREETAEHAVTATLRYGRQVNGASWRRTVTLDAETGELLSVYSSAWMSDETMERKVSAAEAETLAADFLRQQKGEQFAETALYDSDDAQENERRVSHSFTFAQKANGYFFPESSFTVGVDATDGSISAYNSSFREDVTFDAPDGILRADAALEAWLDTYAVQLGYVRVPTAVDYTRPEYMALLDYGIAYLYQLTLGYTLEREDYLLGIDAKTGAPVVPDWAGTEEGITYSDLSGHWAEDEILRLAQYGVGYGGGAFRPDAALTQLDLVALLASTEGYLYDDAWENAADDLYEYAFGLGLLRREARNDNAVLTRAETVRLMLDAVGYGSVARLQGIFRTKFTDDTQIPAAAYGHVALAQGLGMVSGDGMGRFLPNTTATRAQAAVMLHDLLDR